MTGPSKGRPVLQVKGARWRARWTASRWPKDGRVKGLSFTVHKILVGILDTAERFAAALNPPEGNTRWTTDMARRRVGRQVEIPVTA